MIWPFRRRCDDTAVDDRLAVLDTRLADVAATVEHHDSRVNSARSRAEAAAERRRLAIEQNHFDRLFIHDLRGGRP